MNSDNPYLKILRSFILAITLISCSRDQPLPGTTASYSFSGITETDNSGNVIKSDSSDWQTSGVWNEEENTLFGETLTNHFNPKSPPVSIEVFPNPFSKLINIKLERPSGELFQFRIVDQYFNVLASEDSIFADNIALDLSFAPSDTLRVYYRFVKDQAAMHGHGDIVKK